MPAILSAHARLSTKDRFTNLQLIRFYTILQKLLPPQSCLGCAAPVYRQLPLCEDCEEELPWQPPGCPQCGLYSIDLNPGEHCFNCKHSPPAFDECHCVFAYEKPVDTMIRRFKDHGLFAPARCLGRILAASFRQHYLEQGVLPELLAPVPLHDGRLRQRGFNQSLWMARQIQKRCGVSLLTRACSRLATVHSQRGLGAQQRQQNMQGVFAAGPEGHLTAGRHIAIIDDVVTTTATANAMAQVLRQCGASRIDVWALARVN
ncbi:MAG TPA: double zinc ribbon domain-containing protein [Pseudohongiella sp.]|nr:double zinc ribbon domain-containing protein [Pseudohongiella sp.]